MRRKDREVKDFETIKTIIESCDVMHIGIADDDLFPYVVPVNFGCNFDGENITLYFHGATAGRKYELLRKNKACSFEMYSNARIEVCPDVREITTRYMSVMGKAKVELLDDIDKKHALELIINSNNISKGANYNPDTIPHTAVFKLTVTEISGKVNK